MKKFKGTKGKCKSELDKSLYFNIKVEPDLYIEIYDSENSESVFLEANAKLIQSAPELLEMLHKVTNELSNALKLIHGSKTALNYPLIKDSDKLIQSILE